MQGHGLDSQVVATETHDLGRAAQIETAALVRIETGVPAIALFDQLQEVDAAVAVELRQLPVAPRIQRGGPVGLLMKPVAGLLIVNVELAESVDALVHVEEIRQRIAVERCDQYARHPAFRLEQRLGAAVRPIPR